MSSVHCDQCGCDFASHTCPGCAAELPDEATALRAEVARLETKLAEKTKHVHDLKESLSALAITGDALISALTDRLGTAEAGGTVLRDGLREARITALREEANRAGLVKLTDSHDEPTVEAEVTA